MATKAVQREAAAILRRIVQLLPMKTAQGSYLLGHADAFDPSEKPEEPPRGHTD
jgi:hypothetical protein